MTHLLFLFLVALMPIFVSAHGYIGSVSINGQSYQGNQPGGATNPSVIRQVSTISPVKGSDNPSLYCGMNATVAANVANVSAGTQILVHWVGGATGGSHWPHTTGPIMHYMTKCSGSCSSYSSTDSEWFKVSELGVESDGNTWYQADIAAGEPANVTIPSNIEPGEYLLRSELISLQLAVSMGGAEFYPGCIQLSVSGSGSGGPTSSEECEFPGCYTDSDPGIYDPNIYNPPLSYTFPGPPVAAFVQTSGSQEGGSQPSGSSGGSSAASTAASSSPSPTGSGSSTASGSSSGSSSSEPTNTYSPSATIPNMTTFTPSATSNHSELGASCYLSPSSSTSQLLSKRDGSKRGMHKRRLVRHT